MCLAAASATEEPLPVPGTAPFLNVGVILCEDDSAWHGFSFPTYLGVQYEVETSTDLRHWDLHSRIYGTGHRETILLKEAPPQQSASSSQSTPPAPGPVLPRVTLLMRDAIGGGVVLSWLSLDDGSPRTHHLPLVSPAADWSMMPFYLARHGGHDFFLLAPAATEIQPPSENTTSSISAPIMVSPRPDSR